VHGHSCCLEKNLTTVQEKMNESKIRDVGHIKVNKMNKVKKKQLKWKKVRLAASKKASVEKGIRIEFTKVTKLIREKEAQIHTKVIS